ncbi:MAG TPA: alpha/beta fold hydrolase [Solirubrobacteraceae bacterium]|nr:alpha/beta fold hydrolase [Solirubrobacteraceae bacterium]
MPTLPLGATELYYERRGEGPPLLLVQGMGAHSLHWGEPFLKALERDLALVLYDHRGIGRSGPPAGDLTISGLAADALALLDVLDIERAHVLGISMGGMVAQELALVAPQRVSTLTLGCTSCGGTQSRPTPPQVIQRLTAAALSGDFDRVLRTGFEFVVSRKHASDPAHFAAFVAAAKHHPASLHVLMDQKIAIEAYDAYARLRALRTPTLVIHGTADELLAAINGDLIASLIPGARLELLEGVGHLFFWEQPQRSADLVREFVLGAEVPSG